MQDREMPDDAESRKLLKEIRGIWGSDLVKFRVKLAAKTGKHFSRQRINRWFQPGAGIPHKWRAHVRRIVADPQR